MFQHAQYRFLLGMAGASALALMPNAVQAQVTATPTVTLTGGGLYHYDYAISNTSADDLFDIDIHVQPDPGAILNLSAPAGFVTAFDSGLGLVSFLEDSSFFTPVPLSGFTYDSSLAPQSSVFDANFAPLAGGITTTGGSTLAALAPAAVPEPGSLALLGAGGMAACFAMRKRRNRANSCR